MNEPPQHEDNSGARPVRAIGWCHWHNGLSDTIRLVQAVEQGAGFGGDLFACASCRQKHRLTPIGDQP